MDEELCIHGIVPGQCHICRHSQRVYVTSGGSHFHWYSDCAALIEGQAQAHADGLHLHPIEAVSESKAITDGRVECKTCRRRKRGDRH